jgi:viologen exporter family transport system permease protein
VSVVASPGALPRGRANRRSARRHLALLRAFARQGLHVKLAYRSEFWVNLLNAVIKVAAIATVWRVLYRQSPGVFPIGRGQMVTYAILGALASEVLTWWEGPHFYIGWRVRQGTLVGDLLRPVALPYQLFAIRLGESLATLATMAAPALLVAGLVFGLEPPAGGFLAGGLAFAASLCLSFVVLYCLNFLAGMVVILTTSLPGVATAYHGVMVVLSGVWIPLWFYPGWLRALADALPFRTVFFTPLSIYVGFTHGSGLAWALASQLGWTAAMVLAVAGAWRGVRRRLVIQGG